MKYLTVLRQKEGWSKSKLARMAEITPGQLGQIEAGRFIPYPVQLKRIAKSLGISEEQADQLLQEVE